MKARHHWVVRLTHWVNAVALVVMVGSGLRIFNAYPRFARRGESFCCWPWEGTPIPAWLTFGGWLGGARNWHFAMMWVLVLNGLVYLGFVYLHGEWRDLVPRRRDPRDAWEMAKFYLFVRRDHPRAGKHNALQKGAYFAMPLVGIVIVLTGLAIWKPVSLAPLTELFGGFVWARYWHFMSMALLVLLALVHVFMVLAVDPYSLRSMITGGYSERLSPEARNARPFYHLLPRTPEPSHDAHRPTDLSGGGSGGGGRVPGGVRLARASGGEGDPALGGAQERGGGAGPLPPHGDGLAGEPPARGGGAPELLHLPHGAHLEPGGARTVGAGGDGAGAPPSAPDPARADAAPPRHAAGDPLLR
ncbi:MAG: Thiosulfate reductase cytochrome B subunit (membrane anchoring protein), partial [uncultured Gemmatimonadetes bacterium]